MNVLQEAIISFVKAGGETYYFILKKPILTYWENTAFFNDLYFHF